MDKTMTDFDFKSMSLSYKLRDFFIPRIRILREIGIKQGFSVLDYGCGPGSYMLPLEKLVGSSGRIFALDLHPLATQRVQKIIAKNQLNNVEVILCDRETQLPDKTIDVILFYDILHSLNDVNRILKELHRVLKPAGILSCSDHHLKGNQIVSKMTDEGLFQLSRSGKRTHSFSKK